jgi:hypothetical protein
MKRFILAGVALLAFTPVAVHGECKCHKPERDDSTRWGGNQAIVLTPDEHFRELRGIVEVFEKELVEVFDKPEYLVSDKPWSEKPKQNRLRVCVTSADGKFCFKKLPDGVYEVRVSRDQGWNVTHVYVVVDHQAGMNELHVGLHIGT